MIVDDKQVMQKTDATALNGSQSMLVNDGDKFIELHYKWGIGYIQVR